MTTYFTTVERNDSQVSHAMPIPEEKIADYALRRSGGGFNPDQVAKAMVLNRQILEGTWSLDTGSGRLAVVKVEDAS